MTLLIIGFVDGLFIGVISTSFFVRRMYIQKVRSFSADLKRVYITAFEEGVEEGFAKARLWQSNKNEVDETPFE